MEDSIEPRRHWRHRLRTGRAPALALAAALGLSLVLLASAVFSIVGRSQDLARTSVKLHTLNESIRTATVVRAQVTLAAYLAEVDSAYGTKSGRTIRTSVQEAQSNLGELESVVKTLPAGTLTPEAKTALQRFTRSARRALELTTGGRPGAARLVVQADVAPSFIVLRDRLASQRDSALAGVKEKGSALGRLGRLASFVIAFVLPTVAVVVYRQITRRSRESISLATALSRERGQAKRRRRMLASQLAKLQHELADFQTATPDDTPAAVRRLGWDVEALIAVVTETRRLTFQSVDLAGELSGLRDMLESVGIDIHVVQAVGTAWADSASLASALRCLVLEAQEAGAGRIELTATAHEGRVQVMLVHDGAALTPSVSSLVFTMSHDTERAAAQSGTAPIRLLAAQELIEAMGGSLSPLPGVGRPGFLADLPHAGEQPPLDPGRQKTAVPVTA